MTRSCLDRQIRWLRWALGILSLVATGLFGLACGDQSGLNAGAGDPGQGGTNVLIPAGGGGIAGGGGEIVVDGGGGQIMPGSGRGGTGGQSIPATWSSPSACQGTSGAEGSVNGEQGFFKATGDMASARERHTATQLANGKVLIFGGLGSGLAGAELYDPASGRFVTTGQPAVMRIGHTATLLQNAKVLIAGGMDGGENKLASAELYDPTSGTFTATGNMTVARMGHTATALPNGKVLIAGGGANPVSSAESRPIVRHLCRHR